MVQARTLPITWGFLEMSSPTGKNGSNRSYLKHLREIAEFYNVSESYLLGKTDIKNRPPEPG